MTAVRADALVAATVDAARATAPVVKALHAWAPATTAVPPPPVPQAPRAPAATPAATARPDSADPAPVHGPAAPRHRAGADPRGGARARGARRARGAGHRLDPWAALRRALVRGQLTEAAARQRDIAAAPPRSDPRPGAEPLPRAELQGAVQVLLEGIGSVMAGDGVGGGRALAPLAVSSQANLSVRWLALHWSARASIAAAASRRPAGTSRRRSRSRGSSTSSRVR